MTYRIPMDNFTKQNEIIYSHLGAGGSENLRAQRNLFGLGRY